MERAPPALLILWGSCESSPSVLATNGFFQKLMAPEEDPLHSATWGSPSIMLAAYPGRTLSLESGVTEARRHLRQQV